MVDKAERDERAVVKQRMVGESDVVREEIGESDVGQQRLARTMW